MRDAAELLDELGHEVEEVEAPWSDAGPAAHLHARVRRRRSRSASSSAGGDRARARRGAGRAALVDDLERIRERSRLDYLLRRSAARGRSRAIVAPVEDYDVVLTPALAQRPVADRRDRRLHARPVGRLPPLGQFTPYTAIFNVTGQPAISLPLFHGDDGLPLAVQLAGRPAGEGELLALAAQLEAARPWAQRQPEQAAAASPHSPSRPARVESAGVREREPPISISRGQHVAVALVAEQPERLGRGSSQRTSSTSSLSAKRGLGLHLHQPVAHAPSGARAPSTRRPAAPARAGSAARSPQRPRAARRCSKRLARVELALGQRPVVIAGRWTRATSPSRAITPPAASTPSIRSGKLAKGSVSFVMGRS